MNDPGILYLGDSSLSGAAGYLAGLMTAFQFQYDYVPSHERVSAEMMASQRKLFILSDYGSSMMSDAATRAMLDQVRGGAGLLMIGGWESFHGHGGNFDGTAVGDALPVNIAREDDRVNCDQPALLTRVNEHDAIAGLPWDEHPPTVGGFNQFTAKPGATTLLTVQQFAASRDAAGDFKFLPQDVHPMLVVGSFGAGRTAALATDLAPHWVGGLVDWGDGERITSKAPGSWQIEVGNFYSQFVLNLLEWCGNLRVQEPV